MIMKSLVVCSLVFCLCVTICACGQPAPMRDPQPVEISLVSAPLYFTCYLEFKIKIKVLVNPDNSVEPYKDLKPAIQVSLDRVFLSISSIAELESDNLPARIKSAINDDWGSDVAKAVYLEEMTSTEYEIQLDSLEPL